MHAYISIHEDTHTFTIIGTWPTVLAKLPARLPSINHSNVAESFALYDEARSLHYNITAHTIWYLSTGTKATNVHACTHTHTHTHIHTHRYARMHTRAHTRTHLRRIQFHRFTVHIGL